MPRHPRLNGLALLPERGARATVFDRLNVFRTTTSSRQAVSPDYYAGEGDDRWRSTGSAVGPC
jgi:hypothetical protein